MDFKLENIAIPDIWDLKSVVTKVKNVVLNYTEMEAKVHEATDNEPWGASSTLMQEISQGTFNYQYFNEIMPAIYKRFTEKEAKYWRQIYKALVLLEYLVKHGAERVVDDARNHIATVKMLRNFHYIDEKAKDQGINVRNRAKELAELLSDIDKIKLERKKAKQTRNKYTGVSSDTSMGFGGNSSRYSGYGSSELGYGGSSAGFHDEDSNRGSKYDDFDFQSERSESERSSERRRNTDPVQSTKWPAEQAPSPPKSKVADLFDFGDEPITSAAPTGGDTKGLDDDWGTMESATSPGDDFDDFQSAPISNTPGQLRTQTSAVPSAAFNPVPAAKPLAFQPATPAKAAQTANLFDLLDSTPVAQSPGAAQPAVGNLPLPLVSSTMPSKPTSSTDISLKPGDIWASSLVSLDLGKPVESKPATGPSMASLAQNSTATAWTTLSQPFAGPQGIGTQKKQNQNFDDLI